MEILSGISKPQRRGRLGPLGLSNYEQKKIIQFIHPLEFNQKELPQMRLGVTFSGFHILQLHFVCLRRTGESYGLLNQVACLQVLQNFSENLRRFHWSLHEVRNILTPTLSQPHHLHSNRDSNEPYIVVGRQDREANYLLSSVTEAQLYQSYLDAPYTPSSRFSYTKGNFTCIPFFSRL